MFVAKKDDILICNKNSYKVINLFEYKDNNYLLLMSIVDKIENVLTNTAPIYIAKEILSDDCPDKYSIDLIEDQQLIDEILAYFNS